MSKAYECFRLTVEAHVAALVMDRPPVNAQTARFLEEIVAIFDDLGSRPDVRAIVLTGAGRTFSAGADLKERPALSEQGGDYARHNRLVRAAFEAVLTCPKPVIAAINGAAIGAGCVLASCCDILLSSTDGFMAMTEVNVGLAGGVAHMQRHFGQSDVRLMILTGRRIGGPELLRMGVVSACLPPEELVGAAQSIAKDIATKSPSAIRAAKRSFVVTQAMPLDQAYRFEQTQTAQLSASEDTQEALRAFSEKRIPVFGD